MKREETRLPFSDGLVVSRHPVLLLLCTLDTSTALSFGTGVYGDLINFIISFYLVARKPQP